MKQTFTGIVKVPVVELRFPFSGKVTWVKKHEGQQVAQWETLATLDKKLLQAELDRQLADYEKIRAEFELFGIKFGKEGGDDTTKYLRVQKQADLNRSVKEVEIAKYKLDQADLVTPVAGYVLSQNGLVSGTHITPASSTITIAVSDQRTFVFSVSQKDANQFLIENAVLIQIDGIQNSFTAKSLPVVWGEKGLFLVTCVFDNNEKLLAGMEGVASIDNK